MNCLTWIPSQPGNAHHCLGSEMLSAHRPFAGRHVAPCCTVIADSVSVGIGNNAMTMASTMQIEAHWGTGGGAASVAYGQQLPGGAGGSEISSAASLGPGTGRPLEKFLKNKIAGKLNSPNVTSIIRGADQTGLDKSRVVT